MVVFQRLDQPNPISEPSISGDKMESDTNVKCVEQPKQSVIEHNGSGVLSSNDQTSIQPNSDESMTTTETKDDDEHDKNHELSDQQDNTNLSRNSSQNGPRVYDSEFLRSLRNQASDYAVEISNQDNIREIIKRVCIPWCFKFSIYKFFFLYLRMIITKFHRTICLFQISQIKDARCRMIIAINLK